MMLPLFLLLICTSILAEAPNVNVTFSDTVPQSVQDNSVLFIENYLSRYTPPFSDEHIRSLIKNIPNIIQQSAKPYGYFTISCKAKIVNSTPWKIHVDCTNLDTVKIEDVVLNIQGPGKLLLTKKIESLSLVVKNQNVFNAEKYEEAKQQLLTTCYEHGYLNANTNGSKIVIDPSKNLAHITLVINTESPVKFGNINFSNDSYDPNFLRLLSPFKPGDNYDQGKLFSFQQSLLDTEMFEKITVQPQILSTDNNDSVPINVQYDPINKVQLRASLGYNSDTNANMMLRVKRNRIGERGQYSIHELKKENLFGDNGKLIFTNSYIIPLAHPKKNFLSAEIILTDQRVQKKSDSVHEEKSINFEFSQTRMYSYEDYQQELVYGLMFFGAWDTPITNNIVLPSRYTNWFYPKFSYQIGTTGDDKILTHKSSIDLMFNNIFFKAIARNALTFHFSSLNRLVFKHTIGNIYSNDYDALPPSWNFLTGGNTTIRGFEYNSIGTHDRSSSFNRFLFETTLEHQYSLFQNFFLINYLDLGKASYDFTLKDMFKSIGSGVIWESPVGIIELSVARRLQDPSGSINNNGKLCNKCRYILAFKNKI